MTEKYLRMLSHLSVASVSGMLMKAAKFPIASHSNVLSLCGHVSEFEWWSKFKANGVDRDAMIHIVFNPTFLR